MAALGPYWLMSAAVFIRSIGKDFLIERVLIFLSFALGAAAAVLRIFELPELPSLRFLFSVFLGCVLFLAASGFGLVLLPAGMFLFGFYAQLLVLPLLPVTGGIDIQQPGNLIFSFLLVPLVYLSLLHGLCAASSLRRALFRASPTARSQYQSELASSSLFSLFSLAVLFYFT